MTPLSPLKETKTIAINCGHSDPFTKQRTTVGPAKNRTWTEIRKITLIFPFVYQHKKCYSGFQWLSPSLPTTEWQLVSLKRLEFSPCHVAISFHSATSSDEGCISLRSGATGWKGSTSSRGQIGFSHRLCVLFLLNDQRPRERTWDSCFIVPDKYWYCLLTWTVPGRMQNSRDKKKEKLLYLLHDDGIDERLAIVGEVVINLVSDILSLIKLLKVLSQQVVVLNWNKCPCRKATKPILMWQNLAKLLLIWNRVKFVQIQKMQNTKKRPGDDRNELGSCGIRWRS